MPPSTQAFSFGSGFGSSPFKRLADLSQGAAPAFGALPGAETQPDVPAAAQAPVVPAFVFGDSKTAAEPAGKYPKQGSQAGLADTSAGQSSERLMAALSIEVVSLVLARLDGGFQALARSACVSRAWREEAQHAARSLHVDDLEAWPLVGHFPNVEHISLANHVSSHIKHLAPLNSLSKLVSFEASSWDELSDLAGLASSAATLRALELGACRNGNPNWAQLHSLTHLTRLRISGTSSFDVSAPLAKLVLLEHLDVHNNGLRELDALTALTRLTRLNISRNAVADFEPLSSLQVLRQLECDECDHIQSLSSLLPLMRLTRLSCERCIQLEDLIGVPMGVRKFICSNACGLTTLAGLDNAQASLRDITIVNMKLVTSLLPLSHCVDLTTLTGDSCGGITSLSGLQNLGNLRHLSARSCHKLSRLEALSALTALLSLDISGSVAVTSVASLRQLTSLTHLNIQGCYGIADVDTLPVATKVQAQRRGPWGNPFG